MIPYTYQIMKKFVCAECGTTFESGSPIARYCTMTCQRTAKSKRRKLRDTHLTIEQLTELETRYFARVANPSVIQLQKYAEMTVLGLTQDKPVQFSGVIPMWNPPKSIIFVEQEGVEPKEWLMFPNELAQITTS